MNGQVYDLPMQLFERFVANFLKSFFEGKWDVVIVNMVADCRQLLNMSDINDISMVQFLKDAYFVFQQNFLFFVAILNFFLYINLLSFDIVYVLNDSKGKLATLHFYQEIGLHFYQNIKLFLI